MGGDYEGGQTYQQEARHQDDGDADHVYSHIDGIAMVGTVEHQVFLEV